MRQLLLLLRRRLPLQRHRHRLFFLLLQPPVDALERLQPRLQGLDAAFPTPDEPFEMRVFVGKIPERIFGFCGRGRVDGRRSADEIVAISGTDETQVVAATVDEGLGGGSDVVATPTKDFGDEETRLNHEGAV